MVTAQKVALWHMTA